MKLKNIKIDHITADDIQIPLVKEILATDIRKDKMGSEYYITFKVNYKDEIIRYDYRAIKDQSLEDIKTQIKIKIAEKLGYIKKQKDRINNLKEKSDWVENKEVDLIPNLIEKWNVEYNEAFNSITIKEEKTDDLIAEFFFYNTMEFDFALELKRIEKRLINFYNKNKK